MGVDDCIQQKHALTNLSMFWAAGDAVIPSPYSPPKSAVPSVDPSPARLWVAGELGAGWTVLLLPSSSHALLRVDEGFASAPHLSYEPSK